MEIIPAIDLKNGKCVRLYQGDYDLETVFSDDPVGVALKWESMGAGRIHLVDLDGAASGKPQNLKTVEMIIRQIKIPVQLGGGIREASTVKLLLGTGVSRVILGTVAIEQAELVRELCQTYGEAIMVSIDARDGYVATHGWLKPTKIEATELAGQMKDRGVHRIMYTDIKRDGTLTEPAYASIAELIRILKIPVVAAGGISRLSHLKRLARIGAEAAIVGRALYTGDIDLQEALNKVKNLSIEAS